MVQKNFVTTKEASKISGYTPNYITCLAKSKKISGKKEGPRWLIKKSSLLSFLKRQSDRKTSRARVLARTREAEYARNLGRQSPRRSKVINLLSNANIPTPITVSLPSVNGFPAASPVSVSTFSNGTKNVWFREGLAISAALLVVSSGALAAQSSFMSSVSAGISDVANQTALGFNEAFGNVPLHIATTLKEANKDTRSRMASVAARNVLVSAQLAPPLLIDPNLSYLQMDLPPSGRVRDLAAMANARRLRPVTEPFHWAPLEASIFTAYTSATQLSTVADAFTHTYRATGEKLYALIQETLSAYGDGVMYAGAEALSLAARTRDVLAQAPTLVNQMNLALGKAIIDMTHASIQADVILSYKIATAAPEVARSTVAFVGGVGDLLARATARAPVLATAFFLRTTAMPAKVAPQLAQAAFDLEYGVAMHFVALTNNLAERYLATLTSTQEFAYKTAKLAHASSVAAVGSTR